MSNDFDDATQLGSIGHNPSVPSQPGQQQPAFHTPNLPEQPQADEDPEGTLLSAHGTTKPALPQQSAPATPNQPRFRQPMPQNLRQPAADPAVAMPAQQPVQPTQPVQPSQPVQPVKQSQPVVDTSMMTAPSKDITEFHEKFAKLVDNVSQVVVGKEAPIRQCATAMVVGGHILLEDNPGTGKTQLARGLANSIDMSFKRIQFTPDLLPSDVVGVTYYDQKKGEFEYREGPIFASIVLADEINRASPKTQSALLEVMEEQKVTVDGVTHPVPQPFMVIATQNPVGSAGTQLLPQAQLDRFMISVSMGYPDHQSLVELLRDRQKKNPLENAKTVVTRDEVLKLQKEVQEIYVADQVLDYVADLAEATRKHVLITLGLSPRGTLALVRMAKAAAYMKERDYVIPKDVQEVFKDVAAHRMILDSKARYQEKTAREILSEILSEVPEPKVEG